tara:strand:+ start:147 stop:917 length:771 start_codon:yes stop_codon:yes gene_type:complete
MILNSNIIGKSSSKLIVLHGFLGMSNNWKSYAKKMQDKDFELHLIDQRNHGDSFHSSEFNYKIMADDIFNYLNLKKISKVSIMGHSMGGKTAMMFSSLYPSLVDKLIIVDILPIDYQSNFSNIFKYLNSMDLKNISSRKEADIFLKNKIQDSSMRGFLLKNLQRKNNGKFNFKFNLNVLKSKFNEVELAPKLKSPFLGDVLFVKGEKSKYIDPINLDKATIFFPKLKFIEIPNAGHWVHVENPEIFFERINYFLKN